MKTGAVSVAATGSRFTDFLALTKPRLNSLVVVTAGVGYVLGAASLPTNLGAVRAFDLMILLHTVIGSALVAGAAAALNQLAERDIDEAMERTRRRPIPSARVQPAEARLFASVLAGVGIVQLTLAANVLAALLAVTTLVTYVWVYTPLKRRTHWATLVGAIPGALPPVIGWAAARGSVNTAGWVIFFIVFLWQLPHFHALSWMYREDFRRGNLPLLAVIDTDGRRTARHALGFAILLVPVSALPIFVGLGGQLYLVPTVILGMIFVTLSARFAAERTHARARALFVGSLVYLPLLWGLLVFDTITIR